MTAKHDITVLAGPILLFLHLGIEQRSDISFVQYLWNWFVAKMNLLGLGCATARSM